MGLGWLVDWWLAIDEIGLRHGYARPRGLKMGSESGRKEDLASSGVFPPDGPSVTKKCVITEARKASLLGFALFGFLRGRCGGDSTSGN
jgi:hypothetical protein